MEYKDPENSNLKLDFTSTALHAAISFSSDEQLGSWLLLIGPSKTRWKLAAVPGEMKSSIKALHFN